MQDARVYLCLGFVGLVEGVYQKTGDRTGGEDREVPVKKVKCRSRK